ncbi:MAG TPA: hypothetical protein VLH16_00915 [Bacteroidales bacterium]|nr:hypothetical protein [Bacteroidales bacterium]
MFGNDQKNMKISGFSMVRNAAGLYYPIRQAIQSVLPLVDEFVIAIGKGDEGDTTREIVAEIVDPKIKIIDTVWDIEKYPRGTENAHQTDIAKSHCTGNWLLYLQADEVIHEKYLPVIKQACEKYLNDHEVEGLLFNYIHFWGDYDHYHNSHGWYPREIRIIRNHPDIHSWESAQSFRRIPAFDGKNYRQQQNTHKLKVVLINAWVYHYGWVRPPELMRKKSKALDTIHKGVDGVKQLEKNNYYEFDYGPLSLLPRFTGSHPAVMKDWIAAFNWGAQLQYSGKPNPNRRPNKHETLRNRVFTFLKKRILQMPMLGEFKNYILLRK